MNNLSLVLLLSIFMASCASIKPTTTFKSKKLNKKAFLTHLENNQLAYNWYTAKINGNVKIDGKTTPINATLRIKKDSIIWLSINAIMGIEALRVSISKDSLRYINRLDQTYFVGSIADLSKKTPLGLNFKNLQDLLTAHAPTIQFSETSLFSKDSIHELTTSNLGVTYKLKLLEPYFVLKQMEINTAKEQISVEYYNFEKFNSVLRPKKSVLKASKNNRSVELELNFSKETINVVKKLNFKIPKNYAQAL